MKPSLRVLGFVMVLGANARSAEHDWPAPPRADDAKPRVSLALSNRAGLVEAPFVTAAFPEVSGFGDVLTADAAVRVAALGWARARLPIAFTRLDFPAGAQVSETAPGNLELGFELPFALEPSLRLGLLAAFVAPTAEHGPGAALLGNRALALGSTLNGGKDSALFTPGVTGARLGASVEHSSYPFELRASLNLPVLFRISDASLPDETETNALAILPALDLRAAVWITSWFGASLAGALIAEPVRVREPVLERDRARRLQAVLEPGLHASLGQHWTLGLDGSVPVDGNLGGDAWSVALEGRIAF